MSPTYIHYPLADGSLHDWLVAGPVLTPLTGLAPAAPPAATFERFHRPESGVTEPPVDNGPVGEAWVADPPIVWRYCRTRADHLVDLSAHHAAPCHLRAWAYAEIELAAPQAATLLLTTHGPADVWLNGQHLHRQPGPGRRVPIPAQLAAGVVEILVRFEQLGLRDTPYALALQVQGLPPESQVRLPTDIEPEYLARRPRYEALIAAAAIDKYVYGYPDGDRYNTNEPITLRFADGVEPHMEISARAQSLRGDIFQEATIPATGGYVYEIAKAFPLRNGAHHLALLPPVLEYYQHRLRFDRKELFYVVRAPYSLKAGATVKQRAQEALTESAERRGGSLFTEIAKMFLGQWNKVHMQTVHAALDGIAQRRAGAASDLLGFLGLRLRHRRKKLQLPDIRPALQAAMLGFRYGPGDGHASVDGLDDATESAQIVLHACEILAGQLFPAKTFALTGQAGEWHRDRGEGLALAWLRERGRLGFQEWDSPAAVEGVVAALTHLVDLAASDPVRELASVLLDKLFFGLAVNSYRGAYGSTRGRADTAGLLSARLEATSGLARLLWGQGAFTEAVMGQTSLALCRHYELPEVIRQIALSPVDAVWSQERHAWPEGEVNKAVYKTRDYMLACAQDYRPGQPGAAEHIWQATLGYDAVVFVNHPASMSEDDAHRPNLWAGNGVLPRAVQWGDVVLSLFQLPADDWLGFTHAYFPARAFDEHVLAGGWAFARQGDGYLALTAQHGLDLITAGQTAWRELRSPGLENGWVCHLGQALLDGSFAEFQQKVLALDLHWDSGAVRFTSLRGDRLALDWEGPLRVNDEPQNLVGPNHIENPYGVAPLPATHLDIVHQGEGLRLKFE